MTLSGLGKKGILAGLDVPHEKQTSHISSDVLRGIWVRGAWQKKYTDRIQKFPRITYKRGRQYPLLPTCKRIPNGLGKKGVWDLTPSTLICHCQPPGLSRASSGPGAINSTGPCVGVAAQGQEGASKIFTGPLEARDPEFYPGYSSLSMVLSTTQIVLI